MPELFIFIPLILILILNYPNQKFEKVIAYYFGIINSLIQIILAIIYGWLLTARVQFWQHIIIEKLKLDFINNLSVDFFSQVMLFMIGLVSLISLIVHKSIESKENFNFVNLIIIITMGMNGIVMTQDIFSLYVFLEITSITSFILISINKKIDEFEGAFKYLVMSILATVLMLIGIAFIYFTFASLSFKTINMEIIKLNGQYPHQIIIAIILFVVGLSIKSGIVPFHAWLPGAYSAAESSVSILLAGIVTKISGVYVIMRIVNDVFVKIPMIENTLMVLGIITVIIGALACIGQNDFKRMLAYSSISQIGYIILSISTGSAFGFTGALFHFFNHSILKSLLFVNQAAVESRTNIRDITKLGGIASKMPVTGGTSIVAFLSVSGIPPLSGFWSKLIIIMAVWQSGHYEYAIAAIIASIITLGYFLILQNNVFFGKLKGGFENLKEADSGLIITSLVLSAITVGIGLMYPFVSIIMQNNGLLLK